MSKILQTSNDPAYDVFTVKNRGEERKPFWIKIGAAWPVRDGDGYSLQLNAFPVDGRLVLLPFERAEEEEREPKR